MEQICSCSKDLDMDKQLFGPKCIDNKIVYQILSHFKSIQSHDQRGKLMEIH